VLGSNEAIAAGSKREGNDNGPANRLCISVVQQWLFARRSHCMVLQMVVVTSIFYLQWPMCWPSALSINNLT